MLNDLELIPADAEAAGGPVVPLHEDLKLVRVMDGAAKRLAGAPDFDPVADAWDSFALQSLGLPHWSS
jgi:hypothetical protein